LSSSFKNAYESHDHSRGILDLIYGYDSFLDSLSVVADFGCGDGFDSEWWATLETRDDPPEPRNYLVYAIDKDTSKIDDSLRARKNVRVIEADFEDDHVIPRSCDLLWAHDSFHYSTTPLQTLKLWNQQMTTNGMLMMSIPQNVHYQYNRLQNNSHSGQYYNYNIVTLMYMLAVNGFDCRDAYFYRNTNDPWLYAAVYKSHIAPMNPKTTSWHDLAELGLINDSVIRSINIHGFVKQDDIITTWLDKDFYRMKE
jgi:SAM-dependent methyltransferase